MPAPTVSRCTWCGTDPLYVAYHDEEWGVPEHDEHRLFEMLILEGAQAGLSWITVLRKRENYRKAFAGFDPRVVSRFGEAESAVLLADPGIVRNRAKIAATIGNARAVLELWEEGDTLERFLWSFVGGQPMHRPRGKLSEVLVKTPESDAMSKALLARGFKFVGSTICYALMQATGMVDDHVPSCFRFQGKRVRK